MKNATFDTFTATLQEMGHAFAKAMRFGLRAVATMSWPMLLVTCVALALAITIVPLALFLFVMLMLVKLVIALIVTKRRRALPHGTFENKAD